MRSWLPGLIVPDICVLSPRRRAPHCEMCEKFRGVRVYPPRVARSACASRLCSRSVQPPTAFRLASRRCLQPLLRSLPARPSSWRRRTRRLQSWRTCQPQRWSPVSLARGWSLWFACPVERTACASLLPRSSCSAAGGTGVFNSRPTGRRTLCGRRDRPAKAGPGLAGRGMSLPRAQRPALHEAPCAV